MRLGPFEGPLSELYARAKLVVIPLFHGSGLSIKTVECLGMGRVAVSTPVGARGLPESSDAFVCIDMLAQPKATADAIVELLEVPSRRRQMQVAARAFFQQHFSATSYFRTMDRVMASIGLTECASSPRNYGNVA